MHYVHTIYCTGMHTILLGIEKEFECSMKLSLSLGSNYTVIMILYTLTCI